MTFYDVHRQYPWKDMQASIMSKTENDVVRALNKHRRDLDDFMALVSPAADAYLEQMATISQKLTQKRFGKTIQFYVPLYLSNECTNQCVYCGFNIKNKMPRTTLDFSQIQAEVEAIKTLGFGHVLLVTGEHPGNCGPQFLKDVIRLIRNDFHSISAEIAPLPVGTYQQLISEGLNAVYIYQETYNPESYTKYHPGGPKANFRNRLETPDRLGMAGIYKTGLGVLLGLEDWRTDSFFAALHLRYLQKKYWRTKYSISLPRLKPTMAAFMPQYPVGERQLLHLILAFRIFDEEVELSLSTRETAQFRDKVFGLGITLMSAGSKTVPGGYANRINDLEQFAVHDNRPAHVIREVLKSNGYEVVWKDWDQCMQIIPGKNDD